MTSSKVQMEARPRGWTPGASTASKDSTHPQQIHRYHQGRAEADAPESCAATQRVLRVLEKWALRKHRKFSKGKNHALSLERKKPPQTSWKAALQSRCEDLGGQQVEQ